MFSRTISGLINKFLFYQEPIVWVEGTDDFSFYKPLLYHLGCRIEAAGGKDECKKLAVALNENDYPFVVIIDGDYDILIEDIDIQHYRVIRLNKYSIENYVFNREVIQSLCAKYLGGEERIEEISSLFDEVEADIQAELYDLIILDITNYRCDFGFDIFPSAPEKVIDILTLHCLPNRIREICESIRGNFEQEHIEESNQLVENFLLRGSFSDLVRGHFIFGIVRNLVITSVHRIKKKKPNIDNTSILIMLALELWNIVPSESHRELKSRLEDAVVQARQLKAKV